MNREARISESAGNALLRPFRFDGLQVERFEVLPGSPAGAAGPCEVLLWLDFAGETGESPGDLQGALAELLERAARRIGSDGVLLLALPNRFGLRFWSGCPEPGTGRLFSPLSGDSAAGSPRLVSRRELAEALADAGLAALEWFFPVGELGDSADPGALFCETLVAAAPEIASELATGRPFADPVRPRLDLFPEALVSRELARAGLCAEFSNFFLVAASASHDAAIWSRLRPPGAEIGWHYAADRKEPTETIFELGANGVTVSKRRRDSKRARDLGDFIWVGTERSPIAPGEALRLRLQEHLIAGRFDAFLLEFAAFFAFIRARFGRGSSFAGDAVDALVTNATRDENGTFHLFDLEWRARKGIDVSWWILRNVLACLDMRGPAIPGVPTGAVLYETLCQRLHLEPRLTADLACEREFSSAVRASRPELHAAATATALARPWPVTALQGGDGKAIREAMELAACHEQLVADYRKLEAWALNLESQLLRREAPPTPPTPPTTPLAQAAPEAPGPRAIPAAPLARPKVRAIVVHHRNAELLDHCLRAALGSTGVDLDLVLFENDCREALPDWVSNEPRVHRLASPRALGFGAANNRAVAWSRAHLPAVDAYFFLNNDAVVRADTVARLAAVLDEHPDAAAAGPLILIWGAEDHLNSLGLNLSTAGEAWDEGIGVPVARHLPLPGREEVLAVTGSAMLVRRRAFEVAGGWSQLFDFYMEDLDLCLRFRRRGQSVWLVPDAVVAHAVSATAGPASEFKLFLFWRNRWILMLLHWPWRRLLRAIPDQVRIEHASHRARVRARDLVTADRQRRAWLGALALLPRILAARLGHGSDESWWKLLKAAGTAPTIVLPEVVARGRPWESAIAGGVPR